MEDGGGLGWRGESVLSVNNQRITRWFLVRPTDVISSIVTNVGGMSRYEFFLHFFESREKF